MTDAGRSSANPPVRVDYVALPVGSMVGRYEVLSVLGHGGFGITYLARDSQLDREVALKEYLPAALAVRQDGSSVLPRSTEAAGDFGWGRGRFIEEGRTLANLHDAPSIVRVFDFLEANGTAYIVMERLRGETLEERVKQEGPLTPSALEAILWPLLAGLETVHATGFLHRDIKPANIMLGAQGKATLIDFGASRAAVADRTGTMTAIFTPGYAAPEQLAAAKQGPWTDIYGLAATLHYAITGEAPPSAFDRLMKESYEPLASLRPRIMPRNVLIGIDAALSIHADERPQTIADWRALLRQRALPADATVVMRRPPAAPLSRAPPTAGKAKWLAVAAAFVLLGAGGYYIAAALQPAAGLPPGDDTRRALQEAEAGRQRAETVAEQLKVEATRREAEGEARRKADARALQAQRTAAAEAQAKREADEKSKIEQEAKARAVLPPSPSFDGTYGGSISENTAVGRIIQVTLLAAGASLSGQVTYQRCGTFPVSLALAPSGEISGNVRLPDATACALANGTAGGRVTNQGIQLELRGLGTFARGTLVKARDTSAPVSVAAARTVDGGYAGSLSSSTPGGGLTGMWLLAADLRVSHGRLTGQLIHPTCGATSLSLPVDAAGAISGTVQLHEGIGCSVNDATASGKVSANALTLDIRGITGRARGSLSKRAE